VHPAYLTGDYAYSVAIADLNGDGKLDLAIADQGDGNVSVLLNAGDGTFLPQSIYSVGNSPQSIVAVDVNGDGKADLVVANSGLLTMTPSNTVSVLLGKGDGTFLPQMTYDTGMAPCSVAAADLNDDGKPDLVVANYGDDTVSVLLGKGDGSFLSQEGPYPTGTGPSSVAVADLNGDGKPDLVVTSSGDSDVNVLLNAGDGTFALPDGGTSFPTYPTGRVPASVAIADLNGDGKPDLAVANAFDNTVSVLLGEGDGTFLPQLISPTGMTPSSIAVADLNGDGKPDLAVANAGTDSPGQTVSVLLGQGDGSFPLPDGGASYPAYPTGTEPQAVAAADLNGDGKPDLAVANFISGSVSVLLNHGDGTFPAPTSSSDAYPTGGKPRSVAVVDLNGDGKLDLAVANAFDNTVSVLLNAGDGTFPHQVAYPTGAGPLSVAAADLNGDGKLDLAVANASGGVGDIVNTVSVLYGKGDGTFDPQVYYPTGVGPDGVAAADLNGDGKPDVVVANSQGDLDAQHANGSVSVLINAGDGKFEPQVVYPTGLGPSSVAVADLNGDGKPDLIVANGVDGNVSVLLGKGDGTFLPQVIYPTGSGPSSVVVADLNGDGKLDLVVANSRGDLDEPYPNGSVSVLLNAGAGTFAPQVTYPTGVGPSSVAVVDLNDDGELDLAVTNYADSTVSVLFNAGAGTFAPQVTYPTGVGPTSVAAADLNSDTQPDLVVANIAESDVIVLRNTCSP
jgi:uncharacterized protein (DUF2141 family)